MKEGLIIGMALGVLVGGIVVGSSKKAQQLVSKSKNAIKKQIQNL